MPPPQGVVALAHHGAYLVLDGGLFAGLVMGWGGLEGLDSNTICAALTLAVCCFLSLRVGLSVCLRSSSSSPRRSLVQDLAVLLASALTFYATALLFGQSVWPRNSGGWHAGAGGIGLVFLWSLLMACMVDAPGDEWSHATMWPYLVSKDINRFAGSQQSGRPEFVWVCLGRWGALLGAWIGAFAVPLDWDRPWQPFPISSAYGALVGHGIGTAAAALGSIIQLRSKTR